MSKSILPATISTVAVLIIGFAPAPLFEFRPLPAAVAAFGTTSGAPQQAVSSARRVA